MNVLGICGSPRRGGNTDILLERVLAGARENRAETEKVMLADLTFRPCQSCTVTGKDGACRVQDDMQTLYPKIAAADVIVLATPIYFGSVTAQTKSMIDRFQCQWLARHIFHTVPPADHKRPGVFVCVQASEREEFFANARLIVRNFFATVDVEYSEEVFCTGLEAKGDVLNHADCLSKGFAVGSQLTLRS